MEFIKRAREGNKYYDYFKCECGNEFKRRTDYLKKTDCGCKRTGKLGAVAKHPLYERWNAMKKRARKEGIEISKELQDFYLFVDWVGDKNIEGLLLTRKDLNKSYTTDNCVFVDKKEFDKIHGICEKMVDSFKTKYKEKDHPLLGYKRQESEIIKRKETCIKKYGVDNVAKNEEIQEKIKKTNIKKYGLPCIFQTEQHKERVKEANLANFGYEYPTQHPEKKKEIIKKLLENRDKVTSKEEDGIRDYINSLGIETRKDFDKIIPMKELDILIPSKNIAIEYCGLYWHSEKYKERNAHYYKYKKCLEKGIKLLTIFSDEWLCRNIQVKNHIHSLLGLNNTIYARKCKFVNVEKEEALSFINNQHIQKLSKKPKFSFGLEYNNTLYSVMTFDLHPRNTNILTLNRFCSLYNFTIIGGASKLFKNSLKQINTDKIVSWSDNRWSNGNVYEKLGFKLENNIGPDYSYYKNSLGNKRITKQSMTKTKIGCPKNKTEKEFLEEQEFYRVWDCGKKRWVYNV